MITRRLLLAALLLGGIARPSTAQSALPVYDPANGHWYQAVRVAGAISWDDARTAAQSLSYAGYPGHLVTITSAAESDFVAGSVVAAFPASDQWWLGGYQDTSAPDYLEPAGGWRWVTGEPWSYTHWEPGQPDNYGGNEDALDFHHGPVWNDFPRSSGLGGYIVEYEPLPIATGPLLSIQPNPVVGGQPAVGQVMLAQPAGPGGVVVTLTSSNPVAAVVPAAVTVPTGANTLDFPVVTFTVAAATPVTISVVSPEGVATATLQVVPSATPPLPPGQPAGGPQLPPGHQAAGSPVYDPANRHWYQAVVTSDGLNWYQAEGFAAALTYAGFPGHLVTITSDAEQQFVASHLPVSQQQYWWMGAYQDKTAPDYREPDGGWRWVTGEPFGPYTHWYPGQPDNDSNVWSNGENVLEFDAKLGNWWNDYPEAIPIHGYIVEFEPPLSSGIAKSLQLVLFPNPALGGQPALGQVALAQPAGPGGIIVTLTSSNPALAAVPPTLIVPAGAGSATFVMGTASVATPTLVTITAGCQEGQAAASLVLLPLLTPLAPAPPFPPVNLLVNGSFEEPHITDGSSNWTLHPDRLPGWRITRGDVDVVQSWEQAPGQGSQSLDLVGDQPGTIEQTFPTVPGQIYRFSGWLAHNNGIPYGRANVSLNGAFFTQLYHDIPSTDRAMHWVPFAFFFRATTPLTTLTLEDVTGLDPLRGTALDGLSVTLAGDQSPPAAPPVVTPVGSPATAPAAPTGLAVIAVTTDRVSLTWIDNSGNETAFAIWRRDSSGTWSRVGVGPPNTTTFTDTSLTPGTPYTYRVRAINNVGASAWTNEVTVTTLP